VDRQRKWTELSFRRFRPQRSLPTDLSDDEFLRRLVALNAERAEEERRGIIRWLRPEFQNPGGAATTQETLALPAATTPGKAKPAKKTPCPKGPCRAGPGGAGGVAGTRAAAHRGGSGKGVCRGGESSG